MKKVNLRGNTITIVGPSTFETLLKAHYLTHATGVTCRLFSEERPKHPSAENVVSSSTLVLIDCQNGKIESCLSEIKADSQLNGIFQKPLVLFNVVPGDIQETGTMNNGIKGLLSSSALPDIFLEMIINAVCEENISAVAGSGNVKKI
jgi:hypothetical protein